MMANRRSDPAGTRRNGAPGPVGRQPKSWHRSGGAIGRPSAGRPPNASSSRSFFRVPQNRRRTRREAGVLHCGGSSNIMRRPPGEPPTFTAWLQQRLEASRLSQRQVANKSGIDHSTISRLLRGERMPSLRTATLLAKAVGGAEAATMPDVMNVPASSRSRPADVEYALRSDESLTEAKVRQIMDYYLIVRRVRPVPPAARPSGPKVRVPIVVQVPRTGLPIRPASRTIRHGSG